MKDAMNIVLYFQTPTKTSARPTVPFGFHSTFGAYSIVIPSFRSIVFCHIISIQPIM